MYKNKNIGIENSINKPNTMKMARWKPWTREKILKILKKMLALGK